MQATNIEWTDFSANLLKYRDANGKTVWHCEKLSPGCLHCYSEALAHRYGKGDGFTKANTPKYTPFFDEAEANKIVRASLKKLAGKRMFIDDMTDLFGEWVPDWIIDFHMAIFAYCREVTFQVLTKRSGRMQRYFAENSWNDVIVRVLQHFDSGSYRESPPLWLNWFQGTYRVTEQESVRGKEWYGRLPLAWPLPNVWLGVSCENQKYADERIPHLLNTPAAVRFLSCEPLLGPVDLRQRFSDGSCEYRDFLTGQFVGMKVKGVDGHPDFTANTDDERLPAINWVIVGGESGHGARPFDVAWARSIVRQCRDAGAACFVKQLGSEVIWDGCQGGYGNEPSNCWPPKTKVINGDFQKGIKLIDRKGGSPDEWPEDLRVRQMPTPAGVRA